MSRVKVLFLGGTISSAFDPVAGGNVPTLDGAAILARTPGIDRVAEVVAVDLARTPASHLTLGRLLEIGETIREAADDPTVDGVVVAQGTDSMEESAFAWDLVLTTPKPVVVTGAMRASSEVGYDGPANILDAVRAAVSPSLRGQGVVVVLAGAIHAADDVVKTHATSLAPFQSPNLGPLGAVIGERVIVERQRVGRRHVSTTSAAEPVFVITATIGMDGALLDAATALGARGLVVAATGAGNTSAGLLEAGRRAMAAGVPVVLVTRTLAGRASTAYAFHGGGATWVRAGAMLAGALSGPKARIALSYGIGAGLDGAALAAFLAGPEGAG
jgi:L-asparaginase